MEVNFRTTKKIAQSNHEIVPLDGRIAPEGCFDRSETFTSYTWPWRLWMIAKRCKLSCSKSTSRERKCVWPFCRKFEVVFSALGRNFSYFQSLLVHHLSSMTSFNHKTFFFKRKYCSGSIINWHWLINSRKEKEQTCVDNYFNLLCKYVETFFTLARANLHLGKLAIRQPNRPLWLWTFFKKFSRGRRRGLDGGGGGQRGR